MRLRSVAGLQKISILIAIIGIPLVSLVNVSFGQERKIDSMFLDLDKNIVFQRDGLYFHSRLKTLIRGLKMVHRWQTSLIRPRWNGFLGGLPIPKGCAKCKDAKSRFGF